jgi:predicted Zn-dependent peptidase
VSGDIRPHAALGAIRKRFARLPAGRPLSETDCYRRTLEEPAGEKRVVATWDDPGRRLVVVFPAARVGTADDDALDVLATVLAGGQLSRLHRRLVVEEGLATSISANNDSRVESGAFWLFAECAQEADPAQLEAALHAELARLVREPVPRAELERAHALLVAGEAFEGETATDLAEALGEWAVDDDWRRAFDGCERHLALAAPALRAVAGRLLRPERRVVGWCVPKAATDSRPRTRVPRKGSRRSRA